MKSEQKSNAVACAVLSAQVPGVTKSPLRTADTAAALTSLGDCSFGISWSFVIPH